MRDEIRVPHIDERDFAALTATVFERGGEQVDVATGFDRPQGSGERR